MKWLIALTLCVGGCSGTPTGLQTCKDACQYQKDKGCVTNFDVNACKSQCDSRQAEFEQADATIRAHCKNADNILNLAHDCLQRCDLSAAQTCVESAAATCDPK